MGFPSEKELERVRNKLSKIEPIKLLPKSASQVDKLKFSLCKEFILHIKSHNQTQAELAISLGVDAARLSEIVKYKIDLFTVDRLLNLLEKLRPSIEVTVA